MDSCGPFPVQFANGHSHHFHSILDDFSNLGSTALLTTCDQACDHFKSTAAQWELKSGNKVRAVRCDGAKEFIQGNLRDFLNEQGIIIQPTAPYAHQQNGKAERYIRTIEDTAQTLMAESGLPMSFLGDAILTAQYLRNRLPTSTLPTLVTPFEVMEGSKPDLSHLRVWGCQCFVLHPKETRRKGDIRRFEAIFIGYDENRIGWRVRDMNGRYFFSRDVIFNENTRGHLKASSSQTKSQSPDRTSEAQETEIEPSLSLCPQTVSPTIAQSDQYIEPLQPSESNHSRPK
ncbi:Copia protein [Termitomyces sp. J132]|nr:Copia protein [Termitomyces sp. J132]